MSPDQVSMSGDLIIRSGHVVTMDRGLGDIPDGDVLVTGGRIDPAALSAPGARELDARAMIVAPGLVETTGICGTRCCAACPRAASQ